MSSARDHARSASGVRRTKFGAVRTEVDGVSFASKKEARRYSELKLLERAGEIENLSLQPRFPLRVNDCLVCTYVGDFLYGVTGDPSSLIVEDVKGVRTPLYRLKAKMFAAQYGFAIREV